MLHEFIPNKRLIYYCSYCRARSMGHYSFLKLIPARNFASRHITSLAGHLAFQTFQTVLKRSQSLLATSPPLTSLLTIFFTSYNLPAKSLLVVIIRILQRHALRPAIAHSPGQAKPEPFVLLSRSQSESLGLSRSERGDQISEVSGPGYLARSVDLAVYCIPNRRSGMSASPCACSANVRANVGECERRDAERVDTRTARELSCHI